MVDMRVSVIIRVQDSGLNLLGNAIFSVYCNTYKDKEVIIVYHGDKNESIEAIHNIIKQYGMEYQIIQNSDITSDQRSKNLNLGLGLATGRYICFLDYDDELYPNHMEDLIGAIKKSGKAWAVGRYLVRVKDHNYTSRMKETLAIRYFYLRSLLFRNIIPIHTYVFDRSALKTVPRFNEEMVLLEDYMFLLEHFVKHGLECQVIDGVVTNYVKQVDRVVNVSASQAYNTKIYRFINDNITMLPLERMYLGARFKVSNFIKNSSKRNVVHERVMLYFLIWQICNRTALYLCKIKIILSLLLPSKELRLIISEIMSLIFRRE